MDKQRVILASASPRRRQLLSYITPSFEVIPSGIEEEISGSPGNAVKKLAADKALDIAKSNPDALVIGADTVVVLGKTVLGKPADGADAARMLRLLSGRTHKVYTGVAVAFRGRVHTLCRMTRVRFDVMSELEITQYVGTGEPLDKAGAYGIQGFGGKFIRRIRGDYFNVMGLPVNALYKMLKRIKADIRL